MDIKKLTPEQNEELKEYVELEAAYHNTIKLLSQDILKMKKKIWRRIKDFHPEMNEDKNYSYDDEKGEVTELEN